MPRYVILAKVGNQTSGFCTAMHNGVKVLLMLDLLFYEIILHEQIFWLWSNEIFSMYKVQYYSKANNGFSGIENNLQFWSSNNKICFWTASSAKVIESSWISLNNGLVGLYSLCSNLRVEYKINSVLLKPKTEFRFN